MYNSKGIMENITILNMNILWIIILFQVFSILIIFQNNQDSNQIFKRQNIKNVLYMYYNKFYI